MEALHSHLTTGEQSGSDEHSQPESPHRGPQPKSPSQHRQPQQTGSQHETHDTLQQHKPPRRQPPDRKRLRHQQQSVDSDTAPEGKRTDETTTKTTRVQSSSSGTPGPSAAPSSTQSKQETQEGTPKQKRERKPQRPGKYVCTYCGRACAKPSVLQKHIRSHTGERPYPCAPCGFSFKTKSNLYKHRKSHTHRVKAGLASGEPRSLDEPVTESEDETRHLTSASSMERQGSVASHKGHDTDRLKDHSDVMDDSYAVKKRLAMRLSRGKHGPLDSSDDKASSLILGSRGSTESGYFSRSESTEQSQDSPPNTSAKSYAEIILGKYGRLGHLQRMSRHHDQQSSGQEEKNIPFTVPKKQVIDHITKLITINEAVVDTSKIDSVKPRRFSLSRKSSTESQKSSSVKEPIIQSPKVRDPSYKNSGSITMGVPCEKFHHQSLTEELAPGQTSTAPLLRSHSMPSAASSFDPSSGSPRRFRLSQSFDERQPTEMQASRRYGTLRRQPAIEIPLGAELSKEELQSSHSIYHDSLTAVPDHKQCQPQPYECESCGTGCKDWEGYKSHKQSQCLALHPLASSEATICQIDRLQLVQHPIRPGALVMRKRRKEESFEFDDPSSPGASSSPSLAFSSSVQYRDESSVAYEGSRRPTVKPFSVIQHTSSFEKQETLCAENQGTEGAKINLPSHEDCQPVPQTQPQQPSTKPTPRKLVRQHNVQVPEIHVTEDSTTNTESLLASSSTSKQSEKLDEFQWPQRSPTLAQLPIEKLPPKKKRLRLVEAAQSSGESSFDSLSHPRSPSQDSCTSYASSRSTSFEESNRPDMEIATSMTPLRRSRAPNMLTVPGLQQHREMRRSASEQAPHDPQLGVIMAETRSKSFDYSCLSPERSAVGWRERRKCLLMRHSTIRDPDEEDEEQPPKPSTDPVSPSTSSRVSPGAGNGSRSTTSPLSGDTMSCSTMRSPCREVFSQWKLSQNIQLTGSTELPPIFDATVDHLKVAPPIYTGQPPGISLQSPQPYPTQGPSGAARAHYLPMSTGLKLEIPTHGHDEYAGVEMSPTQTLHSLPNIIRSPDLLRPPTSPAIAVRLQADTFAPAYAIYTTSCQTTPSRPQEPVCSISNNTPIPTSQYRSQASAVFPSIQVWSEDGLLRSSGSGGNKRMLSPSNSIELSPESQQQQKRVKEEEEKREDRCAGEVLVETSKVEDKWESRPCLPSVCSSVRQSEPSFPRLQSNTCNSWCYLNYIKPNPSAVDEQKPSVYASWSTSGFDPNPPGLSSKTALSLLHFKQRLSPSIYTTSPMSFNTTASPEPEDNKRPCCTEVYSSQPCDRDHTRTTEGQPSAEDNRPNKGEEEEGERKDEEVRPSQEYKQPPQGWMCEGGSKEKYDYMHGGDTDGCVREQCGFRCKSPCVSPKHTRLQTDSRPCVCEHCNVDFKTKGNLSKHMRSKAHGKKCHEGAGCSLDETDEGVCEDGSVCPEDHKDRQPSDLVERGDDKHDEDSKDEQSQTFDNNPHTSSSRQLKPTDPIARQVRQPERPGRSLTPTSKEPTPKCSAASASSKQALSARRHLEPSTVEPLSAVSSSPGSLSLTRCLSPAHNLSPQRESSPLRSPSPGPRLSPAPRHCSSPSSLSPSQCLVPTTSPVRRASPVRGLSPPPVGVQSPSLGSLGSYASLAGSSSAQYRVCLPGDLTSPLPRDRPEAPATSSKTRLQRALSLDEGTHFCPHLGQPRGGHSVLSHLPLHSQQPARAPSLMIPIGGIHMIQARTAPLYTLARSPTSAPTSRHPSQMDRSPQKAGQSEAPPASRSSPLQPQDTLKETGPPSRQTRSRDRRSVAGGGAAGIRQSISRIPDREGSSHGCFSARESATTSPRGEAKPSASSGSAVDGHSLSAAKTSTLHQGATDAHATKSPVYSATAQGQKTPSSYQTQL